MENRITSLLLPLALVAGAFLLFPQLFGGGDRKPPQTPETERQAQVAPEDVTRLAENSRVERIESIPFAIGEIGEVGFRAEFDNLGGGLRSLRLTDQWAEPGLSKEKKQDPALLYEIIEAVEPRIYSFVAEDFRSEMPFTKGGDASQGAKLLRIQDVPWNHERLPGDQGMRFWLELENGVRFERDFVFLAGKRSFRIVQRIHNRDGAWANRSFTHWVRGAILVPYGPAKAAFQPLPMAYTAYLGATGEREYAWKEANAGAFVDVARFDAPTRFYSAGSTNTFFAVALRAANEQTEDAVSRAQMVSLPSRDVGAMDARTNCGLLLRVEQQVPAPEDGRPGTSELIFDVYAGPKSQDILAADGELAAFNDVMVIDRKRSTCFCSLGSETFADGLNWILQQLHHLIGNWGVAIIILTLIVRAALAPLNLRQAKAMRAYGERMKVLKPKMDALRKRYEKDPKEMNRQLVQFQRENKLFPPLMGCLPMLLTFPVFIGLFLMLRTSFDVFHQPFALWIDDLSVPDRLFRLGLTDLPLVGNYLEYFNLLPILMVALWTFNALRMPLPDDPQQKQMQKMMRVMPILMGVFLYAYASGLALYMVVSALWTVIEQTIVRKKYGATSMPTAM